MPLSVFARVPNPALRLPRIVLAAQLVAGLFVVSALGPLAPAVAAEPVLQSAVAESGRDAFLRYCASCHGAEARGDGPVAPALSAKPPDLTHIAERNGGEFPTDLVAQKIDGRSLPAVHGTSDMPIWGERFGRAYEEKSKSEQAIRGQLLMLIVYLQSVQR